MQYYGEIRERNYRWLDIKSRILSKSEIDKGIRKIVRYGGIKFMEGKQKE